VGKSEVKKQLGRPTEGREGSTSNKEFLFSVFTSISHERPGKKFDIFFSKM
jgi:hypothetical protein